MENFLSQYSWFIALVSAWSLIWKGLSLWRAAHLKQKRWFIALMVINTIGILELIYLVKTEKTRGKTVFIWPFIISAILAVFFVRIFFINLPY